ncbi:hypothetical protein GCM10027190_16380 [Spirosoma areae]
MSLPDSSDVNYANGKAAYEEMAKDTVFGRDLHEMPRPVLVEAAFGFSVF